MSRPQKLAFALLLFLYLLPLWLYPLFPSQDGPSHLYNTVIFSELLTNPQSFFGQFYELNWRPFPNWTFTLLASLFYPLLPILVVEKIILSLYLVAFVCAAFYLLRSINTEKTVLGFAAFLFSYNWFLLMGFYNFCLSLPLALFTIGYYLRHRGAIRGRRVAVVVALFAALYYSHIVACGVTLLVLTLLCGLFGQGRIRALAEVAVGAIIAGALFALHLYFISPSGSSEPLYRVPLKYLAALILGFRIGPWFSPWEWVWLGLLCAVLAAWAGASLAQWSKTVGENNWWTVVGAVLCLTVLVPNNLLGGSALNERLALFAGLLLLPALSARAWKLPMNWLAAVFALLVAAQLAYIHFCFYRWNQRLEPFQRIATLIQPRARVLPLVFEENVVGFYVNPLLHADSYALARARSVSPTNYEGYRDYFPTRYRKGAPLAGPAEWWQPRVFLERDMVRHYDYVLLWKADAATLAHPALRGFRKISEGADGKLVLLKRQ